MQTMHPLEGRIDHLKLCVCDVVCDACSCVSDLGCLGNPPPVAHAYAHVKLLFPLSRHPRRKEKLENASPKSTKFGDLDIQLERETSSEANPSGPRHTRCGLAIQKIFRGLSLPCPRHVHDINLGHWCCSEGCAQEGL